MSSATFESLADTQLLHLTTIGRVTGRPREIEIWFISTTRSSTFFPNVAKPPVGSRTSGGTRTSASGSGRAAWKAVARVLDYRKERQLWDEVQVIADRKYGWGDGLPVEITP